MSAGHLSGADLHAGEETASGPTENGSGMSTMQKCTTMPNPGSSHHTGAMSGLPNSYTMPDSKAMHNTGAL